MAIKYGNNSQYLVGEPQCGGFVTQHAWHYFFLYYMPIMSVFGACVNAWIVWLLLVGNEGRKLLQQTQHVYVLGSAMTNLCLAVGSNLPLSAALFLLPCIDFGLIPCFVFNFVNFVSSYQILFNVGLICFDRWRLVKLGTAYSHAREVRRAKWLLCATSALSALLFLVPEIATPLMTGFWTVSERESSDNRCPPLQDQRVEMLGGLSPADVCCCIIMVIQWGTIVIFTTLTSWKLYKNMKRNKSNKVAPVETIIVATGTSTYTGRAAVAARQATNRRKVLRATLIMFGMVLASLVTFGPLAVVLALLEIAPNIVSGWYQVQILLCLQFSSPALDPFVFALTLPKLRARARARETRIGGVILWLLKKFGKNRTAAGNVADMMTISVTHKPVASTMRL